MLVLHFFQEAKFTYFKLSTGCYIFQIYLKGFHLCFWKFLGQFSYCISLLFTHKFILSKILFLSLPFSSSSSPLLLLLFFILLTVSLPPPPFFPPQYVCFHLTSQKLIPKTSRLCTGKWFRTPFHSDTGAAADLVTKLSCCWWGEVSVFPYFPGYVPSLCSKPKQGWAAAFVTIFHECRRLLEALFSIGGCWLCTPPSCKVFLWFGHCNRGILGHFGFLGT